MAHDFKKFPELTNSQMQFYYFDSPHEQITEDFDARIVKVTDGDTVRVSVDFREFDFPVRMLGINAPELSEGGKESAAWLREQLFGKMVEVVINKKQRVGKFGRLLGIINLDGIDMGQMSLDLGFSRPFGEEVPGSIPSLENELRKAEF